MRISNAASNRMAVLAIIVAVLVMLTAVVSTCGARAPEEENENMPGAAQTCRTAAEKAYSYDWSGVINMFEDNFGGIGKSLAIEVASAAYRGYEATTPSDYVGAEGIIRHSTWSDNSGIQAWGNSNARCLLVWRNGKWYLAHIEARGRGMVSAVPSRILNSAVRQAEAVLMESVANSEED